MLRGAVKRTLAAAALVARQESGAAAGFSGRTSLADHGARQPWTQTDALEQPWQAAAARGVSNTRLTVKTTTKSHRFSHHIKIDREIALRRFWQEQRGVQNPAHLHRLINFSRIYARFRDMDYLPHTMRDWDAAIDRLFAHDRGKQPANDLVRRHPSPFPSESRHPYLLNVKILPLQFAKNAVKGRLPLYDWRKVLRDLREFVGEELPERQAAQAARERRQQPEAPFSHAKRTAASLKPPRDAAA